MVNENATESRLSSWTKQQFICGNCQFQFLIEYSIHGKDETLNNGYYCPDCGAYNYYNYTHYRWEYNHNGRTGVYHSSPDYHQHLHDNSESGPAGTDEGSMQSNGIDDASSLKSTNLADAGPTATAWYFRGYYDGIDRCTNLVNSIAGDFAGNWRERWWFGSRRTWRRITRKIDETSGKARK